jgi:hypothetical protein
MERGHIAPLNVACTVNFGGSSGSRNYEIIVVSVNNGMRVERYSVPKEHLSNDG